MKARIIIPENDLRYVVEFICELSGVKLEQLGIKSRKREIVEARQRSCYILRNYTKKSLSTIGSQIGGKDHATVLHSCKTVENLIDTDELYQAEMMKIEKFISDRSEKFGYDTVVMEQEEHAKFLTEPVQISIISRDVHKDTIEKLQRKITGLESIKLEYEKTIEDLQFQLKCAVNERNLYKRKMEYALIPNKILSGN